MMNLINGQGKLVCGCRPGQLVWIHLINGKAEKVNLVEVTRNGIEGIEVDLKNAPLTFYPFTSIIKVKKYIETT